MYDFLRQVIGYVQSHPDEARAISLVALGIAIGVFFTSLRGRG